MKSTATLVITSISAPNQVLQACSKGCSEHGMDFIVIGDVISPPDFHLAGCDFWSIERQRSHHSRLARILPERHYARKNLGYLEAISRGSEIIIETDDDNIPLDGFWLKRTPSRKTASITDSGWVNIYRYFTDQQIWPRGFPLERVQSPVAPLNNYPLVDVRCPIQQGLADDNPDVDAIYRLLLPLPVFFDKTISAAVGQGSWTPFNSQNTTWFKEAFPLLYLPSYCSFRMTDIWRSFVATRMCWANGWGVLFHGPTVRQIRNEHDLMKDFRDEIVGYVNNDKLCEKLAVLDIRPGTEHLADGMLKCYQVFVDHGVVGPEELPLLCAWLDDLGSL